MNDPNLPEPNHPETDLPDVIAIDLVVLSRRNLLIGLAALGAAVALPLPIAGATEVEVEQAWSVALETPFVFEVTESGGIEDGRVAASRLRAEIYCIDSLAITSLRHLINEVRSYPALEDHFDWLAAEALEAAKSELDNDQMETAQKRGLRIKVRAIKTKGWQGWVTNAGNGSLPEFRKIIDRWLGDSVCEDDLETWPISAFPGGKALRFFEYLGEDIRQALGVVIVDGDHPGSSYRGAELRNDVATANATAAALGLPFRFRQV